MNLHTFSRVKLSAVVAQSDYNLFTLDDNTHVDEMFFAVVETVINDIARDSQSAHKFKSSVSLIIIARLIYPACSFQKFPMLVKRSIISTLSLFMKCKSLTKIFRT